MGVRVGVQDCTGLVWVLGLGYRTDTGVRVGVLRQINCRHPSSSLAHHFPHFFSLSGNNNLYPVS